MHTILIIEKGADKSAHMLVSREPLPKFTKGDVIVPDKWDAKLSIRLARWRVTEAQFRISEEDGKVSVMQEVEIEPIRPGDQ